MEKPLCGHGVGSFVDVYGQSQEAYFAKGDYSKDEEHVQVVRSMLSMNICG